MKAAMLRAQKTKIEKNNVDVNKKLFEILKEVCAKDVRCSNLEFQVDNLNKRCQV